MKAIVYTSLTGHTESYARLLGQETALPVYSLEEAKTALPAGAEIFYLGWLMAGGVKEYKTAAKQFCVKGVAAVGMTETPNGTLWSSAQSGGGIVDGVRVFYLQGGYEGEKLRGVYRLMMKPMEKVSVKKLSEQAVRTPEEDDTLLLFQKGGSRVKKEALRDILAWFSAQTVS